MKKKVTQANIVCEHFKDKVLESTLLTSKALSTKFNEKEIISSKSFKLQISKQDTLNAAKTMIESLPEGTKVGILNFGSPKRPGGGWEGSAVAQEECLFRRSNYFKTLKESFYPRRDTSVVFSPEITVHYDDNLEELEQDFNVCAVMAAALPRKSRTKFEEQEYKFTNQLITNVVLAFITNGCQNIILGALGCGVFNNPSDEVAKIFNFVLKEYSSWFDNIHFAILVTSGKDQNNYDNFVYAFRKYEGPMIVEDNSEESDDEENFSAAAGKGGRAKSRISKTLF
jgi:uncharacterized protein (TIGR02452 family)